MAKPVSDILVLHANGQWGKKVKGKMFYFGSNKARAYSLWLEDKRYLLLGETPPRAYVPPTALQLVEYYADCLKRSVAYGKVGERHVKLVTIVLWRFLSIVGSDCQLSSLSPQEWADVREKLFEPVKRDRPVRADANDRTCDRRSPATVNGDVRKIRAFISWCVRGNLIHPPDWGRMFDPTVPETAK